MRALKTFLILVGLMLSLSAWAVAQHMRYTVNGEVVSGSTYDAWMLINSSVQLIKANRTADAVAKLRRALKFDPTLAEAHSNLGLALARLGKIDEASEQFQLAIIDNKELTQPRLNLASLYQCSGNLSEAVSTYEEFLKDFPENKEAESVQQRVDLLRKEIDLRLKASHAAGGNVYKVAADYYIDATAGKVPKRWAAARMPLRVCIFAGDAAAGYRSQFGELLKRSFVEWEKQSAGKVKFVFIGKASKADIVCEWTDDPTRMESPAENGEAEVKCLLSGITKARIILLLNDASAFPLTDNLVRTLCLHEIGHSLGLLGHSARPEDIMFCTAPLVDREQHLSRRDINTLRRVYQQDVDWASQRVSELETYTNGNAVYLLQAVAFIAMAAVASLVLIIWIARRVAGGRRRH